MATQYFCRPLPRLLMLAACFGGIAGCEKGNPTAQVRGKVVAKSGALPSAAIRVVRFDPAADSDAKVRKGASGVINDDGSFELFTRRPGDGVHLGKYVVTFAFFRSATDQRPLIPSKYTRAATSPYQLVVDKDVDDLQFEIDSAP